MSLTLYHGEPNGPSLAVLATLFAKGVEAELVAIDLARGERHTLPYAGAPLVARWHKKFVRRLLDPTPLTAPELAENYTCFDTEDFRIGYRAFLAKTKPSFEGR